MCRLSAITLCALGLLLTHSDQVAFAAGSKHRKGASANSAASRNMPQAGNHRLSGSQSRSGKSKGTPATATLAKHGLTEFDVDGNGSLDATERATALATKKKARSQQNILANTMALAQNGAGGYGLASAGGGTCAGKRGMAGNRMSTGMNGMGPMGGGINAMNVGFGGAGPMGFGAMNAGMGVMGGGMGPMLAGLGDGMGPQMGGDRPPRH